MKHIFEILIFIVIIFSVYKILEMPKFSNVAMEYTVGGSNGK